MDLRSLATRWAPALTILLGVGVLTAILIIHRARRTARTTRFGVIRDRAVYRARRLGFLAAIMFLLAGASAGLWSLSVWRPQMLPTPEPTATSTLIPSPTPRTPTATASPTPTATVTPTGTPTPIPSGAVLPSVLGAPFPAVAVTPAPEAALEEIVLAAGQRGNRPVEPTTRFPGGTERVYAFFTFDGMSRNVPWSHVWYGEVNGQMVELWSQVELWSYDAPRGSTWRYFNCRAGRYELHVYVGRQLQQQVPFVIEAK